MARSRRSHRSRKRRAVSNTAAPTSPPSCIEKKTTLFIKETESLQSYWSRTKAILKYKLVPTIFVLIFTPAVQFLACQANNPASSFEFERILGNAFSWKVVTIFFCWALLFLYIPSRTFNGPSTDFGYVPVYVDNGMLYYIASFITYLVLHVIYPDLSLDIYNNMPYILGSLNLFALILCIILQYMGINRPQTSEKLARSPLMYEFFVGMEIHPRLLGVDVKQWTNCRVGMMSWQILIIAFLIVGSREGSINPGHAANVSIQTIYIAKFFLWETGYFNTLDMILDRAGYYICWGCLVWVPCLYTYSSFYLVEHHSTFTSQGAIIIALIGLIAIAVNFQIDYEKQIFRDTKGDCKIWGEPAKYIKAVNQITKQPSYLSLSGFWGKGRHLNYTFELMAAFAWCFPGYGHGFWPFLYFIFLLVLLAQRCSRDEKKCSKKYGRFWDEYCKKVRYRMIPYLY